MATQTIEFTASSGLTLTAQLFAAGSDTVVASEAATEATNRKGTYTAAFTDVAAGTYRLIGISGTVSACAWWVDLLLSTATFQAYEQTVVGGVNGLTASDVTAIKTKTDNLPSDPADQSAVEAAITAAVLNLTTVNSEAF